MKSRKSKRGHLFVFPSYSFSSTGYSTIEIPSSVIDGDQTLPSSLQRTIQRQFGRINDKPISINSKEDEGFAASENRMVSE